MKFVRRYLKYHFRSHIEVSSLNMGQVTWPDDVHNLCNINELRNSSRRRCTERNRPSRAISKRGW